MVAYSDWMMNPMSSLLNDAILVFSTAFDVCVYVVLEVGGILL